MDLTLIIENEIKNVWDRASIPTIAFESIVNKYRSYSKSINKTGRESKKRDSCFSARIRRTQMLKFCVPPVPKRLPST